MITSKTMSPVLDDVGQEVSIARKNRARILIFMALVFPIKLLKKRMTY